MAVSIIKSGAIDQAVVLNALKSAFVKLDPRQLAGNPVILATEVVAALATVSAVVAIASGQPAGFPVQIAVWLWLTVLFANFAESIAKGRGKAAADSLRATRVTTKAKLIADPARNAIVPKPAHELVLGDLVLVEAGDVIPADGEIVEGVASVNEAAITGESAPVIRESGGDRSAVTGGTTVVSDWIKVKVTSQPGSSFLDRMIAMVEGADRRKTPDELALAVLLAGLTLVFLIAVVTLTGLGAFSGVSLDPMVLGALFVTLIPTTIGGLLSAVGIAGMDRLLKVNVLATSGRAVEAAGDVDTLLLDKTGTITYGNRMAVEVAPAPGVRPDVAMRAALIASLADETPEGRSIVQLANNQGITAEAPAGATSIPFSAIFIALCGLAYPLAVTGLAGLMFPNQAGGSLIRNKAGEIVGSEWIGQSFKEAAYLRPRPSAAGKDGYDATSSSGSNLGPLNEDLASRIKGDADALREADGQGSIPADAVTASGSGLDPHISPESAARQVARIAAARNTAPAAVAAIIAENTQGHALGFLGRPRVNVLTTNLALDARYPKAQAKAP